MILGIDQGSSSTTAILLDRQARVVGRASVPVRTSFPQPGFVEHDADQIFATVIAATRRVLRAAGVRASGLDGMGLAYQRSTCLLYDRVTSRVLSPCASWQCGRAAADVQQLLAHGLGPVVRRIAGLPLIAFAAAPKLRWLLHRQRARRNFVASTLDAFLVHRLTGGGTLATDPSIAARTLLFDLRRLRWSPMLLDAFAIPHAALPEVMPSSVIRGRVSRRFQTVLPDGLPIAASLGDQQAALIGLGVVDRGAAKITYGTGAFVLAHEGTERPAHAGAFLPTIAWSTPTETRYALEGAVPAAGACLQWLASLLGGDERSLVAAVTDLKRLQGTLLVPALTGLGPPEWITEARGVFAGLERGTSASDLTRGVLEGIAWSVTRVIERMEAARGSKLGSLIVDGGMSQSRAFLDLQSALLDRPLVPSPETEGTALGAAMLAGHTLGIYRSLRRAARAPSIRARLPSPLRHARRAEFEQMLALARDLATAAR